MLFDDCREGDKVLAWGRELYVYEVRKRGYWLTESMDNPIGWYADYYDITMILE